MILVCAMIRTILSITKNTMDDVKIAFQDHFQEGIHVEEYFSHFTVLTMPMYLTANFL